MSANAIGGRRGSRASAGPGTLTRVGALALQPIPSALGRSGDARAVASMSVRVSQNGEPGRLEYAKEKVRRLPGVHEVVADHSSDLLRAEYDPDRVSAEAIRMAVGRATPRPRRAPVPP